MITEYVKEPAKPVRAVRLHFPSRSHGPVGLATWNNSNNTMNPTTVNRTSNEALPSPPGTISGLPGKTPNAKQDLASRPTKATPADVDGHLPEARLRPESLAVLGGMLDVFEQLHADGCPVQLSPGPAKPADGLLTDDATCRSIRKPANSSKRAQGGRTTNFSAINKTMPFGRGAEGTR